MRKARLGRCLVSAVAAMLVYLACSSDSSGSAASASVAGEPQTAFEWGRTFSEAKDDEALLAAYEKYLATVSPARAAEMAEASQADWLLVPRVLLQKSWLESRLGRFPEAQASLRSLEAYAGPEFPLSTI